MTINKFFPLILRKKHCLITQNRFWPFCGGLSGFLGVPRTIYFGCFCILTISLREKNGRKSRDPTRRLVGSSNVNS